VTAAPNSYDQLDFADTNDRSRVVVEWLMSSICNYDCSYCPAALHDGRVRYPDWNTVRSFVTRVQAHYQDSDLTFLLTGGEITTYRKLPALAELLRELGCAVALLSNGSKPVAWWQEHAPLIDEVLLSYHHERAEDDHMLAVADAVTRHASAQFNVVVDPANFDRTIRFGLRAMAESTAVVNFKIMFEGGWKRPTTYSAEQQALLSDAIRQARAHNAARPSTVLKGDMVMRGPGAAAERVSPLEIIDRGLNAWDGWQCEAGVTTLFIRFDEIWRAACRVGGVLGTIYDEQLQLPRAAVVCNRASCNCIAGIKSRKALVDGVLPSRQLPILIT
jgi:organic radical activating enzyme